MLDCPKCLLYLDDGYPFGRWLCNQFRRADIFETLKERTVAMAAYFVEKGERKADPAEWRAFSKKWVRRMIRATQPRVVLVIGSNASKAMELKWHAVERRCSDLHMVYGRTEVEGFHAVYCHGRQGASNAGVRKCLDEVGLIARTSTG